MKWTKVSASWPEEDHEFALLFHDHDDAHDEIENLFASEALSAEVSSSDDVKLCTDSEFQDDPDAAFNDDQCGKIHFNSKIDEIRLHNRGVGCKAFWEYVGKRRFDQVGESKMFRS